MSDSRTTDAEAVEAAPDYDAIVIGAGFAGLGMLHRLRSDGLTARCFEAAPGVGGTWYWNCYPGACSDSLSHVYSFSFDDDLLQEWSWSTRFPTQPEILRYLNHVADRFDLRRDIQLSTRVTSAVFSDATSTWHVTTDQGDRVSSRFLITAVGCLSAAQVPDIPGRDSFAGESYHTGRWPQEGVEFVGKRVGVIGTGSSGIQVIPLIAEQAEHLTVFQRTANYAVPARNAPLDPEWERDVKSRYREIRELAKTTGTGNLFWPDERSVFEVSAEERLEDFERHWQEGGFGLLASTYHDLLSDLKANEILAEFVRNKIRELVDDPEIARKLTPTDHPIGAKRMPLEADYFKTFNRDNVTLVDLREEPIAEINAEGIRTSSSQYELDAIVFATGFDAMTGALFAIDIRSDAGTDLRSKWAEGPRTYLGIGTSGLPNLFMITGPGSPAVLSNVPVSIEQHVEWIGDLLVFLREQELDRIEVDVQAENEWTEHVAEAAAKTLLPLVDSWYTGANIPGKPRIVSPYAGGVGAYRERCAEIAASGYPGFTATSSRAVGAA